MTDEEKKQTEKKVTFDLVKKIIGPINGIGCSSTDKKILENLEFMGELIVDLIRELVDASESQFSYESSVKEIGEKAVYWLKEIDEWVSPKIF